MTPIPPLIAKTGGFSLYLSVFRRYILNLGLSFKYNYSIQFFHVVPSCVKSHGVVAYKQLIFDVENSAGVRLMAYDDKNLMDSVDINNQGL